MQPAQFGRCGAPSLSVHVRFEAAPASHHITDPHLDLTSPVDAHQFLFLAVSLHP